MAAGELGSEPPHEGQQIGHGRGNGRIPAREWQSELPHGGEHVVVGEVISAGRWRTTTRFFQN
jgi:hypothetical protein